MKFGGSSVGNADRIKNVADIISSRIGEKPIVVVSAVKGITDKLIETANVAVSDENPDEHLDFIENRHKEILRELELDEDLIDDLLKEFKELTYEIRKDKEASLKMMDHVQSFGERMSSRILAAHLTKVGVNAKACFAWDIGMITNNDFGNAEPLDSSYTLINEKITKIKETPIITGFIGKTEEGIITTLGRGGSDYTAAIIGSALDVEEIQIWTDVDGIMSADPKIVKNAHTIPKVSFVEASELAYFGAKVLHPKTILPAMKKNIPVRVLNTYNPGSSGTLILKEANKTKETIKAIARKKNITVMNIVSTRMLDAYGFLAKIFDIFAVYKKSVDMISTSEVSISLTVDKEEDTEKIAEEISKIADVKIGKNKSIICVVGEGMKSSPGIAGRTFTTLSQEKINLDMISQGASEVNISFIVSNKDADKAVQLLHNEFFG